MQDSEGYIGNFFLGYFYQLLFPSALDKNLIQNWIELSIDKAKKLKITGKDLTPYLISEINSLSQNKSLEANTALIVNNALLAGKIAKNFSLV